MTNQETLTLSLSEALLLLALHDEKGSIVFRASTAIDYAVAGAGILELILDGQVELADKKVRIVEAATANSPLKTAILEQLAKSRKVRKLDYWVMNLPHKIKHIKSLITDQLTDKGILREDEKKVLWIFSIKRYPTVDGSPESQLRRRIHDIVLGNDAAEDWEAALLGLVKACDLINDLFEREDRRVAKKRIKDLQSHTQIGKAVENAVGAATAAVIAATTAAVAASAAASG
ncbi:MAG TPA: GPP34 family phosphoprotein [Calditrichia bacterium]|nr:GPP34 family phosphoprotein [Calditrichota bacterium]HQU71608.1 GPP34 family phosphoprotein [Calditrichia bacterium]HQV31507.1 GPP34 family phosphoprotein [Calditrichia bacterium]